MRGPSLEWATAFPEARLDFVFIDGCHAYESVREDLAAWWPKVRAGGLFSGHDWDHPDPRWEVRRAVTEFLTSQGMDAASAISAGADWTWFARKP